MLSHKFDHTCQKHSVLWTLVLNNFLSSSLRRFAICLMKQQIHQSCPVEDTLLGGHVLLKVYPSHVFQIIRVLPWQHSSLIMNNAFFLKRSILVPKCLFTFSYAQMQCLEIFCGHPSNFHLSFSPVHTPSVITKMVPRGHIANSFYCVVSIK